jgi:hypothetical protein
MEHQEARVRSLGWNDRVFFYFFLFFFSFRQLNSKFNLRGLACKGMARLEPKISISDHYQSILICCGPSLKVKQAVLITQFG